MHKRVNVSRNTELVRKCAKIYIDNSTKVTLESFRRTQMKLNQQSNISLTMVHAIQRGIYLDDKARVICHN